MIVGAFFLDQCINATISLADKDTQSKDILDSIYHVLKWYKKETPAEKFPVEFIESYELALYLSKYRQQSKTFDFDLMVAGLEGGRFAGQIPLLTNRRVEYSQEERDKVARFVYNRRKLCELTSGRKMLEQKLADLDTGHFDDDNEALDAWESMINQLNTQLMEVKKMEAIEDVAALDVLEDDYEAVMDKLRNQSDEASSLKTGFSFFWDSLPAKGFEPCRFYLFGGTSGVGKSTILVNFLGNAILNSPDYKEGMERETLLYITAENLIDESLERLYCMMTGESVSHVKRKYKDPNFTLSTALKEILQSKQLGVKIIYVPPKRTTVRDIEAIIDKHFSAGMKLKGCFIDYLDLIRSGYALTELRHELGEVTIGLKNLAVTYRMPFVSVTQLNRGGYEKKADAGLPQMGESMQKVDNADFIAFIQNDGKEPKISIPSDTGIPITCKHIRVQILKNRNGPEGDTANMIMKDKLGQESIFNFKIEEKGTIQDVDEWGPPSNNSDVTFQTF